MRKLLIMIVRTVNSNVNTILNGHSMWPNVILLSKTFQTIIIGLPSLINFDLPTTYNWQLIGIIIVELLKLFGTTNI